MPKRRWFRNPFKKLRASVPVTFVDPSSGGTDIDAPELRAIVESKIGKGVLTMRDREYYLMDREILDRIASLDGTDALPYRVEGTDCDDFSYIFLGWLLFLNAKAGNARSPALGLVTGYFDFGEEVLSEFHMMIIFVVKEGDEHKVFLYEPQNDKVYEITKKTAIFQVNL